MTASRALTAAGVAVAVAVAVALAYGGSLADPGPPRPLSIAGIGNPASTATVDSTGVVIDRRRSDPAARAASRWAARARPLGRKAPPWARRMYRRSLLVLRALTDRGGAVIAGARDGWAYVWPRDAAAAALAYAAAGYRDEAKQVGRFLLGLDLDAAARFHRDGTPVPGRDAQGDARGWVEVAARAARLRLPRWGVSEIDYPYGGKSSLTPFTWRERSDYQEKSAGDYLGNAIALGASGAEIAERFEMPDGAFAREADEAESGVDSAAAWAVRPFPQPTLFPAARRSLRRLVHERGTRFGVVPSEDWEEDDPWSAPTAWTAWAFAALGDRGGALRLMGALRRSVTPLGLLPERVDAETGEPRSTTPLSWSHAFAILALRELWPSHRHRHKFDMR